MFNSVNYIPRLLEPAIKKYFFAGKVIILYGARQVGKTTLLKKILSDLSESGTYSTIYYQCDDPDVQQLIKGSGLTELTRIVNPYKIVVFDEAQKISNIGQVLKLLIDNFPNKQFIATGSSSFELAQKTTEPLTGRKDIFTLYPISVGELAQVYNPVQINALLPSLLTFGNYPGIIQDSPNHVHKRLRELSQSYLLRDIFDLSDIRNPEAMTKLLKVLAYQIGNEVSYNELSQLIGIDKNTIEKYILLLEQAFIIYRLPALSKNPRNEVAKTKKIYFIDTGIRNSIIQAFDNLELRPDVGSLWENFCISERLKKLEYSGQQLSKYFWRTYTQKEIDYLEQDSNGIYAYEFKWNSEKKIKKHMQFIDAYNPKVFEVINPNNFLDFVL